MKVRFSDDMIRFRLDRDDVARLTDGRAIFLSLPIAPTSVTVILEPSAASMPAADSRGGVRIHLPSAWLEGWSDSDVVGFDFDVPAADDGTESTEAGLIRVVVEKDFPCSHDGSATPKPVRMS